MSAQPSNAALLFDAPAVATLRADLALALRAAAHHGLGEGVCNHFSVMIPDAGDVFLLNPRGLMWQEVQADDIVLVDGEGRKLAGRHEVERSAMFIHAAIHRITGKVCVLHTHMPYATALTLTAACGPDTTLSQNAMRFHGRIALDTNYNGFAFDSTEGERIARAMGSADIAFLGNHGVVVCAERVDYAYDDLYYLERACQAEVIARSSGLPLVPCSDNMAATVAEDAKGDRMQSELFFKALRRVLS
ncbi:ribulose-5-phosphate 4-epimerase [Ameyamaea chiangmaiensis NBRC 103196]|uniref:Aldolase n=1 Tax=Ameyamaea chiangmaiensis TaxID=442969 RepID=A0A850PK13_9PROT|nr:aldolase [Ameyamaea chiangmaiensis]MBS4073881.1 aldolase [Ameyamaea chiangmaiensis]NVN41641.1 aldolase [Ameyamaea chiangmaiensis]GBQ68076.1 ribulose-5-phosphate 4-epimerase [Ameyamaea chiangmaiensis NBRC 103196]